VVGEKNFNGIVAFSEIYLNIVTRCKITLHLKGDSNGEILEFNDKPLIIIAVVETK
jgi:hypothetical protein